MLSMNILTGSEVGCFCAWRNPEQSMVRQGDSEMDSLDLSLLVLPERSDSLDRGDEFANVLEDTIAN